MSARRRTRRCTGGAGHVGFWEFEPPAARPAGERCRSAAEGALMEYARLLAQHDHPTRWEYPPGFDYKAATARFGRFVADLSAAVGVPVPSETGVHVQDASFHSQAFLPLPGGRPGLIRFSNFGDMATVGDGEPVPEATMAVVLELLARHGYTYVPADVLDADYTGSNPGVAGIPSWRIRTSTGCSADAEPGAAADGGGHVGFWDFVALRGPRRG